MSRRSKKQADDLLYLEMKEEELRDISKYEVILLLRKGLLGFAIGFGLYVIYALSDGDDIVWLHACALGFLSMGVPLGWQCTGKLFSDWHLILNFPLMVVAFIFRAAFAILVGFVVYPISLLSALIRAQRKGSKWKLFFIILLVIFYIAVVLFIIGPAL